MEAKPSLAADRGSPALGREQLAAVLDEVADGITVQDRFGQIAYASPDFVVSSSTPAPWARAAGSTT